MGFSPLPEQFYVNGTQPYYRAPHIYIGLAARFMDGRQVLTAEEAEALGVVALDPTLGYGVEPEYLVYYKDCSDAVVLTTRAGSNVYDRTFMNAFVYPGPDLGHWVSRTNYPLDGGFHQLDDTTMSFYINRHYMQDTWYIQRMSLRIDGIASLHAPWEGGEALTKPFTFEGDSLDVNFRTSAAGSVLIEVTDENGVAIPGFGRECSEELMGDRISYSVKWRSGYSLSQLAGKPVRLRFIMKDADVYSYKFG